MRRAYRILCSSLSRPILSSHTPILSHPRSTRSLQYPFSRLIQSLSHDPTPSSLESSFLDDERKSGLDSLKEAELLLNNQEPENLEKALNFGVRALSIFEKSDGGWSFQVARCLLLLGKVSYKLNKPEESLESLNASLEIFNSLYGGNGTRSEIGLLVIEVNSEIAKVKNSLGKRWEALQNLQRVLELKVRILGPDNKELGTAYADLADAHVNCMNYSDAVPLCLKSLEFKISEFGSNSVEVANARLLLSSAYEMLEQYTEALEQDEIRKTIYLSLNMVKESLEMEVDIANVLISMGQLEEATDRIKKAISKIDKEEKIKAFLLEAMAKALCEQEQFSDAKRCLEISLEIFEKYEMALPDKIAGSYADIAFLYETMSEFEISVCLYKRALSISREHKEMHLIEGSASFRIGWLYLFMQRVDLAVPYLEMAVKRFEGCLSRRHIALGFSYKHLGLAYMETDQHEMAVRYLNYARDIIEETFGLFDDDSIDVNQCLANAYGTMGCYELAMEVQQRVVEAWKRRGPDARDDLREAIRLLVQVRRKSEGCPAAVFPANSLPAGLFLPKK